jgi:hypothetical protein
MRSLEILPIALGRTLFSSVFLQIPFPFDHTLIYIQFQSRLPVDLAATHPPSGQMRLLFKAYLEDVGALPSYIFWSFPWSLAYRSARNECQLTGHFPGLQVALRYHVKLQS